TRRSSDLSFATARSSLQSLHSIVRGQDLLDNPFLCGVEVSPSLGERDCGFNGHDLWCAVLALPHLLDDFILSLDGRSSSEPSLDFMLGVFNLAELTGGYARLKDGAYFRVRHLAHATAQSINIKGALVDYCFALKALITGKGNGLAHPLATVAGRPLLRLFLAACPRFGDNSLSLIAKLAGNLFMCRQDLIGR